MLRVPTRQWNKPPRVYVISLRGRCFINCVSKRKTQKEETKARTKWNWLEHQVVVATVLGKAIDRTDDRPWLRAIYISSLCVSAPLCQIALLTRLIPSKLISSSCFHLKRNDAKRNRKCVHTKWNREPEISTSQWNSLRYDRSDVRPTSNIFIWTKIFQVFHLVVTVSSVWVL